MRSRVTIHHPHAATHAHLPAHEQAARHHRETALHLPNIPRRPSKPQPAPAREPGARKTHAPGLAEPRP